jgi:hypothetical protein
MSAPRSTGPDVTHEDIGNRMGFHPADTDLKRRAHEAARTLSIAHGRAMMDILPPSREKSLAATAMQEALMWSNAALALNGGPRDGVSEDDLETMLLGFGIYYGEPDSPL